MAKDKEIPRKNTLHIKILLGYVLLSLLVGGIIAAIWYEKQVFERAEAEELTMLEQRKLSSSAYKSLLSLFIDNDRAILWDKTDREAYRNKEEKVLGLLDELRKAYPDPMQQARIDTVKILLGEKKTQMHVLAQSLSPIHNMIPNEKLPQAAAAVPERETEKREESVSPAKKKGLFAWLKRKRKSGRQSPDSVQRLQREASSTLRKREKQIDRLSDSLEVKNRKLNRNINRLVNEFEQDAIQRTVQRQQAVSELREEAFGYICIISCACIACVILLYILIYKDVKRKHHYQHSLEKSDKRNRELLEQRKKIMLTLAHDIRGPLNAINGSAELATDIREKRKRDIHLQNIRRSCLHILHLVNDLLDVYRLNEGKDTPNLVPFRLNELLERLATAYQNVANGKGLLFDKVFDNTDVTVAGDADRIEQITGNLLSNAVKFTPSGNIRLAARHDGNHLHIEVSDTGIGMTREDAERVFRPFERAAQHIDADGFGLGLPIVKSLVMLLKGEIDVESKPGKGSRFTVCLPLPVTVDAVAATPAMSFTALPANLHIVAIDDDPVQLHIVKEMTERSGIRCDTCTHIRELVEKLRETDYGLILTDIQMRDTDGFSLLKLLRSAHIGNSQSVPVVAMTARGDTRQEAFAEAGFAGCIYKPFSMTELLQAISRYAQTERETVQPPKGEADFTTLIADVLNPKGVLETFIRSCRQDREELARLIRQSDRKGMERMIHRLLPLWEMLGVDSRLPDLSVLHDGNGGKEEKWQEAVEDVAKCMESLICQAEKLKGEKRE